MDENMKVATNWDRVLATTDATIGRKMTPKKIQWPQTDAATRFAKKSILNNEKFKEAYRGRYPALGHFSFSNFFKLLLAEIQKDKKNGSKEW